MSFFHAGKDADPVLISLREGFKPAAKQLLAGGAIGALNRKVVATRASDRSEPAEDTPTSSSSGVTTGGTAQEGPSHGRNAAAVSPTPAITAGANHHAGQASAVCLPTLPSLSPAPPQSSPPLPLSPVSGPSLGFLLLPCRNTLLGLFVPSEYFQISQRNLAIKTCSVLRFLFIIKPLFSFEYF